MHGNRHFSKTEEKEYAKKEFSKKYNSITKEMKENIEKEPLAKIDYVKAVNGLTMQQQKEIKAPMLIAMAVYIGKQD